jgi:hypothetical protein
VHLGQLVTDSVKAKAPTGIAKNKTINRIMTLSESFFLFMLTTPPAPKSRSAFPMPRGKRREGKPARSHEENI